MVFHVPTNTLPELRFSPEEEQAIVDLADRIVAETLHVNEEFIASERKLSKQEWKLVKAKEQVQVYRKRKVKEGTPQRPRLLSGTLLENHLHHNNYSDSSGQRANSGHHHNNNASNASSTVSLRNQQSLSASSSGERESDSAFGDGIVEHAKPAQVPLVVAHGILPGTVEDVAFGTLAHTEFSWRQRNSYVQVADFDARKILATIHSPTEDDPFRFLGIKWTTRSFGAFMSRRDFVYIEATGMALDSNGDRVSYELIHSIELAQLPELKHLDIIRGTFSKCVIARQYDAASIEVYCRSFSHLGGEIIESVGANLQSENILTIANLVECSYVRKLTWQMQRQRRTKSQADKHAAVKNCEMCDKRLGHVFQSGSACQICRAMICSKCCVEKKVTVDISEEVTQKMLAFCLPCVIGAKKLAAWDVAVSNLPFGQ